MCGSAAEVKANYYQSLFADVASVSSRELLRDSLLPLPTSSSQASQAIQKPHWNLRGCNVLLIDVRSDSERAVSMISGAVSLIYFKSNILPLLEAKQNVEDNPEFPEVIVTYCTIGYRSGMEARKLMRDHPTLFIGWVNNDNRNDNDETGERNETKSTTTMVANLDGICAFANASLDYVERENEVPSNRVSPPLLIDPQTNTTTNRVHVYGISWKHYLSPNFEAITFSRIELAWRGLLILLNSCLGQLSYLCCKG